MQILRKVRTKDHCGRLQHQSPEWNQILKLAHHPLLGILVKLSKYLRSFRNSELLTYACDWVANLNPCKVYGLVLVHIILWVHIREGRWPLTVLCTKLTELLVHGVCSQNIQGCLLTHLRTAFQADFLTVWINNLNRQQMTVSVWIEWYYRLPSYANCVYLCMKTSYIPKSEGGLMVSKGKHVLLREYKG